MNKIIGMVVGLSLFVPLVSFAAVVPVTQVTASSDAGSFVTPSGVTSIFVGDVQNFGFGATTGFHLTNVSFDGISQGTPSSLDVTGDGVDHTIDVSSTIDVTSAPSGGGSLNWCSGPLAPGYVNGIVGGGCGGHTMYVLFNGTSCLFNQGCMLPE